MELFTQLLNALWAQDYETLANPSMIGMLYFVLFMILFLENGLLPAAFLPGDSLLVLVGVLIAKGAMGFPETLLLLHRQPKPEQGAEQKRTTQQPAELAQGRAFHDHH